MDLITKFINLVFAGLKIHGNFRPNSLKLPPWDDNDSEHYLAKTCCNTLSLQRLARITIRNRVMEKMKQKSTDIRLMNHLDCDSSIMKYLISLLGLPRALQRYLYDFPDVPQLRNANNSTISFSNYEIEFSSLVSVNNNL